MKWARLIAWTFEHGHRTVCGGVLVGGLLDVLELETVVEVVQSRAENQYRWSRRRRPWTRTCEQMDPGSDRVRWLTDIQCDWH